MTQMYTDGTYLEYNASWHAQDSPWKAAQIEKMMQRNDLRPSSICEIGCGAGEILRCLADQLSTDVTLSGFDISPQAYEICRQKARENLQFFHADLFDDDQAFFDLVLAIDVIEHIDDFYGFLRQLRGRGEYKIFHIPLDLSVQSVFRVSPILHHRRNLGHVHYFTKETAISALTHTGYEVLDHFYTAGSLDLPGRGWRSNMVKYPRKIMYSMHPDFTVRVLGGFSLLVLAK